MHSISGLIFMLPAIQSQVWNPSPPLPPRFREACFVAAETKRHEKEAPLPKIISSAAATGSKALKVSR